MKVPIEVPLFLIHFAHLLSQSVTTNLIIFRTCYVTLGYNKSECALLGSNKIDNQTANLEKIMQPMAAEINMVYSLTQAFSTALICLFVGPWSDRFGRKPILTVPIVGFMVFYVLTAIFSALEDIPPWYLLVCLVPVYLTGGTSSYLAVASCHITDITDNTNRGMRMGTFEAAIILGVLLGNVSSSYLFTATSYQTVYLISALCCLLNLIFTLLFIPESLPDAESEGGFKSLFRLSNVTDMVRTAFKRRENYERCTILSCALMMILFIVTLKGDAAVMFLYLREQFYWSLENYTLYSAYRNGTWVIGTIVGVYCLHELLKVSEIKMILVGFISMGVGALMMGLAKKNWAVCAAAFASTLGGVLGAMVRSLASKVVRSEEVGKIFSFIVASEALFTMGAAPLYTLIYNATIMTNPGLFNFVDSGICALGILVTTGVIFLRSNRRSGDEEALINEAGEE